MVAGTMVIKKRGRKIEIKIIPAMRSGHSHVPDSHTIKVNLKNFKDVALMFHDLEDLYGVPIPKAIEEYKSGESKTWPFG